ncbi:hypothetical protein Tcan_06674 [Toxocara canis]|uniref:Uncharacterized protein n=1 Tax=Toxocara canis TaxID=6265 RepID=A0A0B2W5Q8_TOXCA|nr:hypothetical protein Tcan_06674 [Toxocara canis]
MSTVSQSTAFSQPLGMFSQSSSALAQLPTTKLPFKSASVLGESRKQNTDGILYSRQPSTLYEGAKGQSNAHDCSGQLSQQQARGAGLNSCLSSTTSFEISSEALSKENSRLGGEDYADFSQPKSCSLNSSSYLASETFDTEDEFLDHSFLGKTPPGNDQIVPTVDTVQANVSDDFALNEIVPRTETVEKEQTDDEIGGTQPIVASKADAATQTDRMVTVQDLLADDELLKRLIVARLKDPVYIAFQKKFSSALLRQPAGKRKIARARARSSAFDKK